MWPNSQFPVDLVTFTEEILNGKPHFYAVQESVQSQQEKSSLVTAITNFET